MKAAIFFALAITIFSSIQALAQDCPENKYFHNGQCLWLHEIECPRGQEYDVVKERCMGCETFGKTWIDDPSSKTRSGGHCGCGPCEDETGDGCTPCYEMGARCSNGKCVGHSREYRGPVRLYYGFAESKREIERRLKLFKAGVADLEAQLGEEIEKAFGYCECDNLRGAFIWALAANEKAIEVEDKVRELASKCGGCANSVKMEVRNIKYNPKVGTEKGRQMMGDGKSHCVDGWCCPDEATYDKCVQSNGDVSDYCLRRSGCEIYGE